MSSDSADAPVAGNDAWKERVREENATFDREAGAGSGEVPAPTFASLVEMCSMQAMLALGMIPHPTSGKPEVQLPLARHFVDLLGVIEAKTTGNLSPEEQSLLGGTLHYLRMSYVEISKRPPEEKS